MVFCLAKYSAEAVTPLGKKKRTAPLSTPPLLRSLRGGGYTLTHMNYSRIAFAASLLISIIIVPNFASAQTIPPPVSTGWPDATNTGYQPTGVTLHTCASLITTSGNYDSCQFSGGVDVRANNVHITRSLINGQVEAYSGFSGEQSG